MNTGTAGTRTDFHTGTGQFGNFGTTSIPVPDASVTSVQHQYLYRTSIPLRDTSVSSVRHQYRYRTVRQVRYDINTGTPVTDMDACTGVGTGIGTTSMPALDTLVSSVRHQPIPPHFDIKMRLLLMQSGPELQILLFDLKDRWVFLCRPLFFAKSDGRKSDLRIRQTE